VLSATGDCLPALEILFLTYLAAGEAIVQDLKRSGRGAGNSGLTDERRLDWGNALYRRLDQRHKRGRGARSGSDDRSQASNGGSSS
jgi:hypothetical protein